MEPNENQSNQSEGATQTTQTATQPEGTTQTAETQNQPGGIQSEPSEGVKPKPKPTPTPKEKPAEATVPVSQLADIVAKALADYQAGVDAKAATVEAEKKAVAAVVVPVPETTPVVVDQTDSKGGLYGNLDTEKKFDLAKLLPGLKSLPKDRFIIIKQVHLKNRNGSLVEDQSGREVQVIDSGNYEKGREIDKQTGVSVYDTILGTPGDGRGYTTVHQPE